MKNKKGLELVTSRSSGYKTSSKNTFISYISPYQLWWYNEVVLELFQILHLQIYACQFMKWYFIIIIHKWFHFHLSFWIWKLWKGREKLQKSEYFEKEKSFLDEIKNIFHNFWRAIIWWKNRKWNSRHILWRQNNFFFVF